jgi:hypothetical protein
MSQKAVTDAIDAEATRANNAEKNIASMVQQNAGDINILKSTSATKAELSAEAERAGAKEQEIEGKVTELESKVKLLTFSETFVQGSYPSAYYSIGFGGDKGDILKYSLSTTGTVKYGFEIHGTLLSGGRELIVSRTTPTTDDVEVTLANDYSDITIVVAPKSEGDVTFNAAIKNVGYAVDEVIPQIKNDLNLLDNNTKSIREDVNSLINDKLEIKQFNETFKKGAYPSAYYSIGFGANNGDTLIYSVETTGTIKYGFQIHGTLPNGSREMIVERTKPTNKDTEIVIEKTYNDITIVVAPLSEGDVTFKAVIKNVKYIVEDLTPKVFSDIFHQGSYPSAYYSLGFGANKDDVLIYNLGTTGTVKYGFQIHGNLPSGGREMILERTTPTTDDVEIVINKDYTDLTIVVAPKSEGDVIFKAAIKNTGYVVSGVVPAIKKDVESLLNPSKNVNFDHPLFSLVDDDFENVTRLNIFKNICDTIGIKVTFGVIPDLKEESNYTGEVYIKDEKLALIKEWELQGFQFEYHPVHYLWYKSQSAGWDYVDNVVPEQAMVKVKRLFLQHGILGSNCLVYPGASSDHEPLVEMIKKWVDYAVIAKGGVTRKGESKYKIRRLFLDFSQTYTKSYYKEQIDAAVANNDWLIFGTHSAYYNQNITEADETSMSFVNLKEVLEYAASKAEFKTIKAGFEERRKMFVD